MQKCHFCCFIGTVDGLSPVADFFALGFTFVMFSSYYTLLPQYNSICKSFSAFLRAFLETVSLYMSSV